MKGPFFSFFFFKWSLKINEKAFSPDTKSACVPAEPVRGVFLCHLQAFFHAPKFARKKQFLGGQTNALAKTFYLMKEKCTSGMVALQH